MCSPQKQETFKWINKFCEASDYSVAAFLMASIFKKGENCAFNCSLTFDIYSTIFSNNCSLTFSIISSIVLIYLFFNLLGNSFVITPLQ